MPSGYDISVERGWLRPASSGQPLLAEGPDGGSFAVRTTGGRLSILKAGNDTFTVQHGSPPTPTRAAPKIRTWVRALPAATPAASGTSPTVRSWQLRAPPRRLRKTVAAPRWS